MEEFFVVQKRPTVGDRREKFYFRIVDARTGEKLMHSFLDQSQAEEQCQHLNTLASCELQIALQK